MKRAFREAYNEELALLKERAAAFAEEYPGLADRLGGLMDDNLDPTVAGLLEGCAFLAARVQTKIKDEFQTFTHELLDQIFPDALAPTPSAMLAQAKVPLDYSGIDNGLTFTAGNYLDARFRDADKTVTCRYALTRDLTLWPIEIADARYHPNVAPIGALGQEVAPGTKAGLVIDLKKLASSGTDTSAFQMRNLALDDLVVHLVSPLSQANVLYEQLFCDTLRVSLRWLDERGDPVFATLPRTAVQQIGFDADERLFPHNTRLFDGFAILREFFVFPNKFAGFRLTGLSQHLRTIKSQNVQVIFEFDNSQRSLAAQFEPQHLALHVAPAVNLFEDMSSQVRIDGKHHELIVTPNSTPITHYEVHAITDVWAHYLSEQNKVRVHPLYALPPDGIDQRQGMYFTHRFKPRRLTVTERRFGASNYRYRGTETFLSLYVPPEEAPLQRLQVKTLCSNRHLPEYLPIVQSKDSFFFCEDQTVTLDCVAGPSAPKESLADLDSGASHRALSGDVYWRLISYLSLNHYGLESRDGGKSAESLREMLSLFADMSDNVSEAHIDGLVGLETRPIARTIEHEDGFQTVRGLEIALTFNEEEYEGFGVILLAAALDRFLSEYASINSFTQTVVRSTQRGHIKTFAPRRGSGPLI